MRVESRRRRTTGAAVGLALLAIGSSVPRVPLVLYNRTPSMPTGFYVRIGRAPERGEVVAFHLPGTAWDYARERGERTDLVLLKHVLAVGGDHVSTLDGRLTVNGVDVGPIPAVDSAGRSLPQWHADRVLAAGELLAGSTLPHSFDGRFFGPIRLADVLGVYRRVGVAGASSGTVDGAAITTRLSSELPSRASRPCNRTARGAPPDRTTPAREDARGAGAVGARGGSEGRIRINAGQDKRRL